MVAPSCDFMSSPINGRFFILNRFAQVIGHLHESAATIENIVRRELSGWFGPVVGDWCHIKTQRIVHALPEQSPPMPDPINRSASVKSGIYVCGEYQNVPGIQWALLSGYQAAEQVKRDLDRNGH